MPLTASSESRSGEQFAWFDVECAAQTCDHQERDVHFSALNGSEVAALHGRINSESFLAQPDLLTTFAQSDSYGLEPPLACKYRLVRHDGRMPIG